MKNVRRKVVEMDGAQFTIAPLTLGQLRKYSKDLKEGDTLMVRGAELVCMGLNNARNGDDDPEWTVDRALDEFDQPLFLRLQEEIAAFSGLRSQPAGEPPATSEKS
jgi:hypothetical protein